VTQTCIAFRDGAAFTTDHRATLYKQTYLNENRGGKNLIIADF